MKPLITLTIGVAMLASAANASILVNVDFQPGNGVTYTGQGVLGSPSDTTWNALTQTGGTNLLLADGSGGSSGVSVDYTGTFSNVGGTYPNTLLADRVIDLQNPTQVHALAISGLAANTPFDIVLYNGFYWQDYTVQGQPGLGTGSTRPNYLTDLGGATPPFPTTTFALFQGVMSDGSGQIVILDDPVFTPVWGRWATIAGVQIQEIPEPSTVIIWSLLGAIAITVGWYRRRKT